MTSPSIALLSSGEAIHNSKDRCSTRCRTTGGIHLDIQRSRCFASTIRTSLVISSSVLTFSNHRRTIPDEYETSKLLASSSFISQPLDLAAEPPELTQTVAVDLAMPPGCHRRLISSVEPPELVSSLFSLSPSLLFLLQRNDVR